MHLFRVTESVKKGLVIARDPDPYVQAPGSTSCVLDKELTWLFEHSPDESILPRARLERRDNTLILKGQPEGEADRDAQALVHVMTAGGENGSVRLTDMVYRSKWAGPRVVRDFATFPGVGITPLCPVGEIERINKGVEMLDVFLLMHPGSSFRIYRTGRLENALACMSVTWNGYGMTPDLFPSRGSTRAQSRHSAALAV